MRELDLVATVVSSGDAAPAEPPGLSLLAPELLDGTALDTLDDPVETALFARLVALGVKTLGARRVLDVGCGCGIPTLTAARAGATDVLGVDIMPCNVELTRNNVQRARLSHRVRALHGSWDDVRAGRLEVGAIDLVVANPPYVPSGRGVVVDGGPTGTRMVAEIVRGFPWSSGGLALLFGSISDPVYCLELLAREGFEVCELLMQSVPFGRYTSRPPTLARLKELRAEGRAFFCDTGEAGPTAPHAYLTLGVITRRTGQRVASNAAVREALLGLLADYQQRGPDAVAEGPSLLAFG
jgi:hypothetical protein